MSETLGVWFHCLRKGCIKKGNSGYHRLVYVLSIRHGVCINCNKTDNQSNLQRIYGRGKKLELSLSVFIYLES